MVFRINDDCISCGACVEECPVDCIREGEAIFVINEEVCTSCGSCAEVCPVEAPQEV